MNDSDAERAQRESEQRFRRTFEQAAIALAHVAPKGEFVRVNQRLCELVGYARDELLNLTFQDITHPDDLDIDLHLVQQVLDGEIETYTLEKRYIHKDGSPVWIDLTVSLVRDPSDEPKYFISAIQDISRRKQAEADLQRHRDQLEVLVGERTQALEAANEQLKQEMAQRERQERTIQQQTREIMELSIPVVKIWEGIVLAPLIGTLDSRRSEHFTEILLDRVMVTDGKVALIDITGVPTIDTQTAQHLIETISAVRLLGARVILTGVRPSIAQTLVHLGIDLSDMTTCFSLAAGLRMALEITDSSLY